MTKLKENFKNLWSLKTKNASGFTLVELIVVVAILAILAGIAVPAYSGYVEKAEKAADEQLLATVNTAFASACAINGDDVNLVKSATAVLEDNGSGEYKVKTAYKTAADDAYAEAFAQFYAGNEESVFKGIDSLVFNPLLHQFVDGDATYSYSFAGSSITLNAEDVAVLAGDNAFSKLGSAALLNEVGTLEKLIGLGAGMDILEEIGKSDDFNFALGSYMGLSREDYEDDKAYLEAIGIELTKLEQENDSVATNALIMYAASNAANASDEQISSLFTHVEGGELTSRIEGATHADTVTNAALVYGMYTAYAQANSIDTSDYNNFSKTVNTEEFAKYIASEQGQADLEAYKAAMNMIGDNTDNSAITSSILKNGIVENNDLKILMEEVMGN